MSATEPGEPKSSEKRSLTPEDLEQTQAAASKKSKCDDDQAQSAGAKTLGSAQLRSELKETERKLLAEKKERERKALKEQKELEKKLEKEKREAAKQAEKEKKEAEKRQLKAEKEKRDAEKRAEKERKDAEKRAEKARKELEKANLKEKKEAEKQAAKEKKSKDLLKAQPKINLFFKSAPTTASSQPELPDTSSQTDISDYQKHILPFRPKQDGQLFSGLCNYNLEEGENATDPLIWLKNQNKHIQASRDKAPARITSQQFRTELTLAQESIEIAVLLTKLRIRRLQFSHLSPRYIEDPTAPVNEEFRPPYVGSVRDIAKESRDILALDPFRTDLIDSVTYDYDSEVEWDHEDGEDLRDDDGDDTDEELEDQEELREFLSSEGEDPSASRRPKLVGPLSPVLLWNPDGNSNELSNFSIELLHGIISPNKILEPATAAAGHDDNKNETGDSTSFASIVLPLQKKIGFDSLKESLAEHNGSTSTKTLIIELLKQKFPMATAQEIRAVFDVCMERVGKKRSEKKWIINTEASGYFSIPGIESSSQVKLEDIQQQQIKLAPADSIQATLK